MLRRDIWYSTFSWPRVRGGKPSMVGMAITIPSNYLAAIKIRWRISQNQVTCGRKKTEENVKIQSVLMDKKTRVNPWLIWLFPMEVGQCQNATPASCKPKDWGKIGWLYQTFLHNGSKKSILYYPSPSQIRQSLSLQTLFHNKCRFEQLSGKLFPKIFWYYRYLDSRPTLQIP